MTDLYDAVCAHPGMAEYMVRHLSDIPSLETVEAVRDALLEAGQPPEVELLVRTVLTFYLIGVMLTGPDQFAAVGLADPRPVIVAGLDYILAPAPRKRRPPSSATPRRRGR